MDASADANVEHSDADLLAAVRAGDDSAYAELWTRHQAAARQMAAQVAPPRDVDDLVSESYYRVLRVVKAGHGPHDAFRPYLFSTMRRFAIDTARAYQRRVTLTDEAADLEAEPAPSRLTSRRSTPNSTPPGGPGRHCQRQVVRCCGTWSWSGSRRPS